ncbi:hypothetical protein FOZ63_000889 [Perkinsus olseni]|uniref:Uncharacterized protein n=1 Tax=Perkinsus olseni TaxID=32597 RepID=A0A7J6U7N1_PEROL|nr:hypothetical protein FOZ63_000889 [Perkinsus olseni]
MKADYGTPAAAAQEGRVRSSIAGAGTSLPRERHVKIVSPREQKRSLVLFGPEKQGASGKTVVGSPMKTPGRPSAAVDERAQIPARLSRVSHVAHPDENIRSARNSEFRGSTSPVSSERRKPHLPKHINYIKTLYASNSGEGGMTEDLDRILAGGQHPMMSSRPSRVGEKVEAVSTPTITTVEEAIGFFASMGSSTSVKFMYLNPRRLSKDPQYFNPYDLLVTTPDRRDREYFTISTSGLVHYCPGEASEHTSLSRWMEESMRFKVLRSMSVFKHYSQRKIITRWRYNARYSRFRSTRDRLSQKLIIAQPRLADAVLQVQAFLSAIGRMKMVRIEADHCYDLPAFVAAQQRVRDGASPVVMESSSSASPETGDAGDGGKVSAPLPSVGGGVVEEIETKLEELVSCIHETCTAAAADALNRRSECEKLRAEQAWWSSTRGIAVERRRQRERELARDLAMQNVRRLPPFIRLAEIRCYSAMVELGVSSVRQLLKSLWDQPKLLSVTVNFSDDALPLGCTDDAPSSIAMMPTRAEFSSAFEELLSQTVAAMSHPYDDFKHCAGVASNAVERTLVYDQRFAAASGRIFRKLATDLANAHELAERQLVEYRRIYEYGQGWDEEQFIAKMRSMTAEDAIFSPDPEGKSVDAAALQREMALVSEFAYKVERLKPVQSVGVLLVEARKVKQLLTPIPQRALTTMKSLLLSALREKCKATGERYAMLNRELDQRPGKLESFVAYLQRIDRLKQNELSELEAAKDGVEELHILARQYKVKLSVDDIVELETLIQLATESTDSKLPAACEFTRAKKRSMVEELHAFGDTIEETARSMKAEILDPDGGFIVLREAGDRWSCADNVSSRASWPSPPAQNPPVYRNSRSL